MNTTTNPPPLDTNALQSAINNLRTQTPQQEGEFKQKLRDAVAVELRKPVTDLAALQSAIETTIRTYTPPKNEEETRRLTATASDMASRLRDLKARTDSETAIKSFNDGLERAPGDANKGDLPLGAILGVLGGAGLTTVVKFGDWKSFGGVMQKLSLVAAGLGVGLAVSDDFGARTAVTNMFKPNTPAGTTPPGGTPPART